MTIRYPQLGVISIHVLREEDDIVFQVFSIFFIISIHVLREEDDAYCLPLQTSPFLFLSTSSARRTTGGFPRFPAGRRNFYPRPPRGGRLQGVCELSLNSYISIHVLREEDDSFDMSSRFSSQYFYPRPPRGGRRVVKPWLY